MRPAVQRSRSSVSCLNNPTPSLLMYIFQGHARRPLPEESFSERVALPRTVESMTQFIALDKELQLDDGLQRHLDTAGAGPSRLAPGDGFLREESTRRVRSQLRQIRQNDEDVLRLDEWREADDSKTATGGKRKRSVPVVLLHCARL
jgi:hypothetical protein